MNFQSNLIVCGLLQVTLVAIAGLIAVAISGRWSRVSAARLSLTTLTAIMLLTALAFVRWPSWLDANSPSNAAVAEKAVVSALTSGSPSNTFDPATTQLETFGAREFISAGIEGLRNMNREGLPFQTPGTPSNTGPSVSVAMPWSRWFSGIFIGGIALGVIRLIGGMIGVRLMVRSSRPVQNDDLRELVDVLSAELRCTSFIDLRESTHLVTAATVGWRRAVILISKSWKSWSHDQLRSVLAHEIAHIVRGDFASNVAAQLGLALHFYHPLVHWLVNRLRLEQELAADAMAARVVGGSQAYLRAIGELALLQSKEQVSWPAHAFLPTRRTFLRRIEMLRDMKLFSDRAPLAVRVSSLVAVLGVTLAVAGIRPPGTSSPSQTMAGQPSPVTTTNEPTAAQEAPAMEAKYVPANVLAVAVFRPSELVPIYKQAREKAEGKASDSENAAVELMSKCKSATVVMSIPDPAQDTEPIGVALSFTDKAARDSAAEMMAPGDNYQKEKLLLAEIEVQGPTARYFADDTTLVFGGVDTVKSMVLAGPSSLSMLTQTDAWAAAAKGTIAVAVLPASLKTIMVSSPPNPVVGMFSPFWMLADSHTLGIALREKAEIKLVSTSPDEKSAKVIQTSMTAAVSMLTGMLASEKVSLPESIRPAVETIEEMLNSQSVERNGNQTTLTICGDTKAQTDAFVAILVPAIVQARVAAKRVQQKNNMKQIMLAMHNYHASHGSFPPAILVDAASGAKRSWRVELLPYLEQDALYQQYLKDQPWDSDSNKAVLAKMPDVFRHPTMPEGTTNASVFAAVGEGLVFEKDNITGTKIQEITDGTSNTVTMFEARRDIPWTKPEDILVDLSEDKMPEFGGYFEGGGWAGLADGSVRFISSQLHIKTLKAILTRAGGEPL